MTCEGLEKQWMKVLCLQWDLRVWCCLMLSEFSCSDVLSLMFLTGKTERASYSFGRDSSIHGCHQVRSLRRYFLWSDWFSVTPERSGDFTEFSVVRSVGLSHFYFSLVSLLSWRSSWDVIEISSLLFFLFSVCCLSCLFSLSWLETLHGAVGYVSLSYKTNVDVRWEMFELTLRHQEKHRFWLGLSALFESFYL